MTAHRAIRVGLTGGIATGKSAVVRTLLAHDVPVVDADVLAKQAVAPGMPALAAIVEAFGAHMLTASGSLDRKALADVVFRDETKRRALEAIVHPRVRAAIDEWFEHLNRQGCPLGVADIPLLFETGRTSEFDYVVVVACDPEEQVARLIARDGLTADEARRRLTAQWPIGDKLARADATLRTDGSLDDTERRAVALVSTLKQWAQASPPVRRTSPPA